MLSANFTISSHERDILRSLETTPWEDVLLMDRKRFDEPELCLCRGLIIKSNYLVSIDAILYKDIPIDATDAKLFVTSSLEKNFLTSENYIENQDRKIIQNYYSSCKFLQISQEFLTQEKKITLCTQINNSYSYRDENLVPSRLDIGLLIEGYNEAMSIRAITSGEVFIEISPEAIEEEKKYYDVFERV